MYGRRGEVGGGEERGLPLIVLGHFSYDTFIEGYFITQSAK